MKQSLHAHHIVPRGVCSNAGSFELINGVALCYHCHMMKIPHDPDGYIEWRNKYLMEKYTMTYQDLKLAFKESIKFDEEFFNKKIRELS